MTTSTIQAVGDQRARLIAKIGRAEWIYRGSPDKGRVLHTVVGETPRVVEVWFFRWAGIPRDVQRAMIASRCTVHGETRGQALRYCRTHLHAIPCAEVEVIAAQVRQ